MKRFIALAILIFATLAHAQAVTIPLPTTYQATFSWQAPSSCTASGAAPCTYQLYRVPGNVTVTGGTTGATLVTTTAAGVLTATDTTIANGNTYSWAVLTVQSGANSVPSNTVTLAIPQTPGAAVVFVGSVTP